MIKVIGKGNLVVGRQCSIGENVTVIFKNESEFRIADYVTLGDNVRVIIEDGNVSIGDWTTVHANTLILSKVGVTIGSHCWFGQNNVIDGTGGLTIEDGVRVGMYSQIWTHVAAGEQIEGCKLFSSKPTTIKRDVWLVGSCTVGSGITIGERAICMNGSNVTKSLPDFCVALGVPAQVREGLSFYKKIDLEEKFHLMTQWVHEFNGQHNYQIQINDDMSIEIIGDKKIIIHPTFDRFLMDISAQSEHVLFCIESKCYTKKYATVEEQLIRFLSSNKARFYPFKEMAN